MTGGVFHVTPRVTWREEVARFLMSLERESGLGSPVPVEVPVQFDTQRAAERRENRLMLDALLTDYGGEGD